MSRISLILSMLFGLFLGSFACACLISNKMTCSIADALFRTLLGMTVGCFICFLIILIVRIKLGGKYESAN